MAGFYALMPLLDLAKIFFSVETPIDRPQEASVIIVGAGMAGICASIKLKEAGIKDIVVLEKLDQVGGTWYTTIYPGVACDVIAHVYSYSFNPNPW